MAIRDNMFSTIKQIFQRHGGVTIDTPVMELKDILSGKYGEESKLIYDLADQGGEHCSLRYDLTVPFARYLAMYGKEFQHQLKRYQIAKVYRRDQPAMTKGRLREFYQCDFDIAGTYDPMIPDAEILRILCETLDALQLPCAYHIKINHRKILDGLFQVCGVSPLDIRSVSSAIDKLDKLPWDEVKQELIHIRGLDEVTAEKIGHYVQYKGDAVNLMETLCKDQHLINHPLASEGLKDMKLLLEYLDIFNIQNKMVFDLSLARGLDYYTGIIYEAIPINHPQNSSSSSSAFTFSDVGSIAAGGRYDDLVGMFANPNYDTSKNVDADDDKNKENEEGEKLSNKQKKMKNKIIKNKTKGAIPCVGVSIGVERVFSMLLAQQEQRQIKSNPTQVFVISAGDGLLKERMQLAKELWDAGINATYLYKNKPKLERQWATCEKEHIPLAVIIGKDELEEGVVKIKDMQMKNIKQGGGVIVQRKEMITELKARLHQVNL
ncbi:histidyl-tRNA synthetase [Cunninghamella echinulata]|nr:histidyl-tRNA synthetase [Cunninghamella echinulata]